MDNEILVKEFRKVIKILRHKHGHIALLMLKTSDTDIPIWNLIVSTAGYDNMTDEEALKDFLDILNNAVYKEILKEIVRLTVLKTDDPFVKEINLIFRIKNSVKYIQSSVITGIYIENGIIFESASPMVRNKIK